MTDPIDTARAEGIALGLAMAKAAPRYYQDAFDNMELAKDGDGAWIDANDIPDPPIQPHVAAARVLLDDLRLALSFGASPDAGTAGHRWGKAHDAAENAPTAMDRPTPIQMIRAALEQIAKEGE